MLGLLGRAIGAIVRFVVIAVVLTVLVSAAMTYAFTETGADIPSIETPEPLPDWPFVWEIPIDGPSETGVDPGAGPAANETSGDPVTEDPGSTTIDTADGSITSDRVEQRIHERINDIRASQDRARIEHDDDIARIARVHSYDMAEREYFAHVNPEGEAPHDRFEHLFPSVCRGVGENIAMIGTAGATDADEIAERTVEGWMNSDGHRENLLRERWDSEGIGVYLSDDRAYATQNFCEDR